MADHGVEWQKGMYADYKKINVQCWYEHEQGIIDRDTLVYQRFKRYFDFVQVDIDPVSSQHQYLLNLSTKPYLNPGAGEVLEWLKGKTRLGYITNGMKEVQRPRLELIGWHEFFETIVVGGEIGHSKPHYGYFHHVQNEMGNPAKSQVLVVGDSLTADIEGARLYGYDTCWYNPGSEKCDLEHSPGYIISHLGELKSIVKG